MQCIVDGCNREAHTRGLCRRDYSSAHALIKSGKVHSWEYLEEIGAALPFVDQRHAPRSLFSKFIAKKKKEKEK